MSREFGDHGSGFFHEKIEYARDDAEGGRTVGAKVMAAMLKPLYEMADAVSSEEACDSGEERTVTTFAEHLEAVEQAVNAIKAYIDPAVEYAAKAMSGVIEKVSEIKETKHHDSSCVSITMKSGLIHDRRIRERAMIMVSAKRTGRWGYCSGSSYVGGSDVETHHIISPYHCEDNVNYLRRRVQELEQQVALLKATSEEKRE